MRREELYLADIVEAADAVADFVAGLDRNQFLASDLVRSAVLQKLTIIGEAAARLSAELRKRETRVEWRDIVGFRNIAVHAYFNVEWEIVWSIATEAVPELRQQVAAILEEQGR